MAGHDRSASSPPGADAAAFPEEPSDQPPEQLHPEISSLSHACSIPPPPGLPDTTLPTVALPPPGLPQLPPPQTQPSSSRAPDEDTLIYNPPPRLIDPSPPRCTTPGRPYVPHDTNPPLPPARGVVEGLADKMSQQTLETQQRAFGGSTPFSIPEFDLTCDSHASTNPSSNFPYPLELEIDHDVENYDWDDLEVNHSYLDRYGPTCSLPPFPEPHFEPPYRSALGPIDNTAGRPITKGKSEKRIMEMITAESQCHVHDPPPATPTSVSMPPLSTHGASTMHHPPPRSLDEMAIEVDDTPIELACTTLEVDENPDDDDTSWMESIVTLRRAANPEGVRKHGLRYRASHEAALRCTNLVRSVPRMRRRKDKHKSRSHKDCGSTATGPASSVAGASSIQAQ